MYNFWFKRSALVLALAAPFACQRNPLTQDDGTPEAAEAAAPVAQTSSMEATNNSDSKLNTKMYEHQLQQFESKLLGLGEKARHEAAPIAVDHQAEIESLRGQIADVYVMLREGRDTAPIDRAIDSIREALNDLDEKVGA